LLVLLLMVVFLLLLLLLLLFLLLLLLLLLLLQGYLLEVWLLPGCLLQRLWLVLVPQWRLRLQLALHSL
jgi:hypothetical protein